MSKVVNVEEAKDWSAEEAAFNVQYLEQRGRYAEADRVRELRGEADLGSSAPSGEAAPEGSTETVPEGTVQEVLDWVGEDKDRAQKALDAESSRDEPRTTLVSALEAVVEAE